MPSWMSGAMRKRKETRLSPTLMITESTTPGPSARWLRRRTSNSRPIISTGYTPMYMASPGDGKGTSAPVSLG